MLWRLKKNIFMLLPLLSYSLKNSFNQYPSIYDQVFQRPSFLQGFTPNPLHTVFFVLRIRALIITYLVLQVLVAQKIGKELENRNSLLCSFLQSAVTSALLGPNILISTPFFNACSLYSSINVRASFTHLRTTAQITGRWCHRDTILGSLLQILAKLLSDIIARIQNAAFCQKNKIHFERTRRVLQYFVGFGAPVSAESSGALSRPLVAKHKTAVGICVVRYQAVRHKAIRCFLPGFFLWHILT